MSFLTVFNLFQNFIFSLHNFSYVPIRFIILLSLQMALYFLFAPPSDFSLQIQYYEITVQIIGRFNPIDLSLSSFPGSRLPIWHEPKFDFLFFSFFGSGRVLDDCARWQNTLFHSSFSLSMENGFQILMFHRTGIYRVPGNPRLFVQYFHFQPFKCDLKIIVSLK